MIEGTIFHAEGNPDIQKTRPLFAFVPKGLLTAAGYNKEAYRAKRWHTINAGANKNAVGSHVFPDTSAPAKNEECPEFRASLELFIQKHLGAASPPKKPGAAGLEIQ